MARLDSRRGKHALVLSASAEQRIQSEKRGVLAGIRFVDFGQWRFATVAAQGGKEKGVSNLSHLTAFWHFD
jgi:hypothetical protein